jgi:hypothetical protein
MTLNDLFKQYQEGKIPSDSRLILCNFVTQDGSEVKNEQDFLKVISDEKNECHVLNKQQSNKFIIYDYFVMRKVSPYVVGLYHPLMTNAYWKDFPDSILDVVINDDGIYRYLLIEYDKGIRDYVIEFPMEINPDIFNKGKMLFPEVFKEADNDLALSLVFTNGNRFTDIDESNFIIYNLEEVYPDWNVKNITPLTLSKKVWNDLKILMVK